MHGAHAVVVLTEWDEFSRLDFARVYGSMQKPAFVFDGRNILDHAALRQIGFHVYGVGALLCPLRASRALLCPLPSSRALLCPLPSTSTASVRRRRCAAAPPCAARPRCPAAMPNCDALAMPCALPYACLSRC